MHWPGSPGNGPELQQRLDSAVRDAHGIAGGWTWIIFELRMFCDSCPKCRMSPRALPQIRLPLQAVLDPLGKHLRNPQQKREMPNAKSWMGLAEPSTNTGWEKDLGWWVRSSACPGPVPSLIHLFHHNLSRPLLYVYVQSTFISNKKTLQHF